MPEIDPQKLQALVESLKPKKSYGEKLKETQNRLKYQTAMGETLTAQDSTAARRFGILPEKEQNFQLVVPGTQDTLKYTDPNRYLTGMKRVESIKKKPEDYLKSQSDRLRYTDKIRKLKIQRKAEQKGVDALTDEEGRVLFGAKRWKGYKTGGDTGYNREKVEKTLKDTRNILMATDDMGNPKYESTTIESAQKRRQDAERKMFWINESDRLKSKGVDIQPIELENRVLQGKEIATEILQQYKSGQLPQLTPEGLKAMINKELEPLGLDYDDLRYFNKGL